MSLERRMGNDTPEVPKPDAIIRRVSSGNPSVPEIDIIITNLEPGKKSTLKGRLKRLATKNLAAFVYYGTAAAAGSTAFKYFDMSDYDAPANIALSAPLIATSLMVGVIGAFQYYRHRNLNKALEGKIGMFDKALEGKIGMFAGMYLGLLSPHLW